MKESKRAPRFLWELVVVLLVAGAALAWNWWTERDWEKRWAVAKESHRSELAGEVRRCDEQTRALGVSEAVAVARGFAAGVHSAVVAGRQDGLDTAIGEFVRLQRVVFVHFLESGGGVIATSDRKLAMTGEAGTRAAWALETETLGTRTNAEGLTEVALALSDIPEQNIVLWIGYDTSRPTGGRHFPRRSS